MAKVDKSEQVTSIMLPEASAVYSHASCQRLC